MEIYGDLSDEDQKLLQSHASLILKEPQKHASYCSALVKIGPPHYFPRYMVQHGMGVFLGKTNDPLVKNFDPTATWSKLLQSFKCNKT